MDVNTTASAFLGILWFVAAVVIVWMALRRRARINALPPTRATIALQLVNSAVLFGGVAMLTIGVYNLLTKL
jgi:hypothetical protein